MESLVIANDEGLNLPRYLMVHLTYSFSELGEVLSQEPESLCYI